MHNFIKKILIKDIFFEIPLLVESKLMKIFDLIFSSKPKRVLDFEDLGQVEVTKNYLKFLIKSN